MSLRSEGLRLHASTTEARKCSRIRLWPCAASGGHQRPLTTPAAAAVTGPLVAQQTSPLSRRAITVSGSLLPLLLASATALPLPTAPALAADDGAAFNSSKTGQEDGRAPAAGCGAEASTTKAFFDVSIDGEPAGRVVVGLYGASAPVGAARFASLVSGAAGITYKRKEFVKITPAYVQHGGIRSYGVDAELARGKLAADPLVAEWEKVAENCPGTKNVAGVLGLVVRDPSKPPPNLKLVARKGKLEIDQEETGGKEPNGTEFVITTKDSPELDASTLVIGRVLGGMEVIDTISNVNSVRENTSSPYFRVAKLIGDKRAVVAERGFNRPYSKVVITNCGLMAE